MSSPSPSYGAHDSMPSMSDIKAGRYGSGARWGSGASASSVASSAASQISNLQSQLAQVNSKIAANIKAMQAVQTAKAVAAAYAADQAAYAASGSSNTQAIANKLTNLEVLRAQGKLTAAEWEKYATIDKSDTIYSNASDSDKAFMDSYNAAIKSGAISSQAVANALSKNFSQYFTKNAQGRVVLVEGLSDEVKKALQKTVTDINTKIYEQKKGISLGQQTAAQAPNIKKNDIISNDSLLMGRYVAIDPTGTDTGYSAAQTFAAEKAKALAAGKSERFAELQALSKVQQKQGALEYAVTELKGLNPQSTSGSVSKQLSDRFAKYEGQYNRQHLNIGQQNLDYSSSPLLFRSIYEYTPEGNLLSEPTSYAQKIEDRYKEEIAESNVDLPSTKLKKYSFTKTPGQQEFITYTDTYVPNDPRSPAEILFSYGNPQSWIDPSDTLRSEYYTQRSKGKSERFSALAAISAAQAHVRSDSRQPVSIAQSKETDKKLATDWLADIENYGSAPIKSIQQKYVADYGTQAASKQAQENLEPVVKAKAVTPTSPSLELPFKATLAPADVVSFKDPSVLDNYQSLQKTGVSQAAFNPITDVAIPSIKLASAGAQAVVDLFQGSKTPLSYDQISTRSMIGGKTEQEEEEEETPVYYEGDADTYIEPITQVEETKTVEAIARKAANLEALQVDPNTYAKYITIPEDSTIYLSAPEDEKNFIKEFNKAVNRGEISSKALASAVAATYPDLYTVNEHGRIEKSKTYNAQAAAQAHLDKENSALDKLGEKAATAKGILVASEIDALRDSDEHKDKTDEEFELYKQQKVNEAKTKEKNKYIRTEEQNIKRKSEILADLENAIQDTIYNTNNRIYEHVTGLLKYQQKRSQSPTGLDKQKGATTPLSQIDSMLYRVPESKQSDIYASIMSRITNTVDPSTMTPEFTSNLQTKIRSILGRDYIPSYASLSKADLSRYSQDNYATAQLAMESLGVNMGGGGYSQFVGLSPAELASSSGIRYFTDTGRDLDVIKQGSEYEVFLHGQRIGEGREFTPTVLSQYGYDTGSKYVDKSQRDYYKSIFPTTYGYVRDYSEKIPGREETGKIVGYSNIAYAPSASISLAEALGIRETPVVLKSEIPLTDSYGNHLSPKGYRARTSLEYQMDRERDITNLIRGVNSATAPILLGQETESLAVPAKLAKVETPTSRWMTAVTASGNPTYIKIDEQGKNAGIEIYDAKGKLRASSGNTDLYSSENRSALKKLGIDVSEKQEVILPGTTTKTTDSIRPFIVNGEWGRAGQRQEYQKWVYDPLTGGHKLSSLESVDEGIPVAKYEEFGQKTAYPEPQKVTSESVENTLKQLLNIAKTDEMLLKLGDNRSTYDERMLAGSEIKSSLDQRVTQKLDGESTAVTVGSITGFISKLLAPSLANYAIDSSGNKELQTKWKSASAEEQKQATDLMGEMLGIPATSRTPTPFELQFDYPTSLIKDVYIGGKTEEQMESYAKARSELATQTAEKYGVTQDYIPENLTTEQIAQVTRASEEAQIAQAKLDAYKQGWFKPMQTEAFKTPELSVFGQTIIPRIDVDIDTVNKFVPSFLPGLPSTEQIHLAGSKWQEDYWSKGIVLPFFGVTGKPRQNVEGDSPGIGQSIEEGLWGAPAMAVGMASIPFGLELMGRDFLSSPAGFPQRLGVRTYSGVSMMAKDAAEDPVRFGTTMIVGGAILKGVGKGVKWTAKTGGKAAGVVNKAFTYSTSDYYHGVVDLITQVNKHKVESITDYAGKMARSEDIAGTIRVLAQDSKHLTEAQRTEILNKPETKNSINKLFREYHSLNGDIGAKSLANNLLRYTADQTKKSEISSLYLKGKYTEIFNLLLKEKSPITELERAARSTEFKSFGDRERIEVYRVTRTGNVLADLFGRVKIRSGTALPEGVSPLEILGRKYIKKSDNVMLTSNLLKGESIGGVQKMGSGSTLIRAIRERMGEKTDNVAFAHFSPALEAAGGKTLSILATFAAKTRIPLIGETLNKLLFSKVYSSDVLSVGRNPRALKLIKKLEANLEGKGSFTAEEYAELVDIAYEMANKYNEPVAIPSPKHAISDAMSKPELEVAVIFPKEGLRYATEFMGVEESGTPIYKTYFGNQRAMMKGGNGIIQNMMDYNSQLTFGNILNAARDLSPLQVVRMVVPSRIEAESTRGKSQLGTQITSLIWRDSSRLSSGTPLLSIARTNVPIKSVARDRLAGMNINDLIKWDKDVVITEAGKNWSDRSLHLGAPTRLFPRYGKELANPEQYILRNYVPKRAGETVVMKSIYKKVLKPEQYQRFTKGLELMDLYSKYGITQPKGFARHPTTVIQEVFSQYDGVKISSESANKLFKAINKYPTRYYGSFVNRIYKQSARSAGDIDIAYYGKDLTKLYKEMKSYIPSNVKIELVSRKEIQVVSPKGEKIMEIYTHSLKDAKSRNSSLGFKTGEGVSFSKFGGEYMSYHEQFGNKLLSSLEYQGNGLLSSASWRAKDVGDLINHLYEGIDDTIKSNLLSPATKKVLVRKTIDYIDKLDTQTVTNVDYLYTKEGISKKTGKYYKISGSDIYEPFRSSRTLPKLETLYDRIDSAKSSAYSQIVDNPQSMYNKPSGTSLTQALVESGKSTLNEAKEGLVWNLPGLRLARKIRYVTVPTMLENIKYNTATLDTSIPLSSLVRDLSSKQYVTAMAKNFANPKLQQMYGGAPSVEGFWKGELEHAKMVEKEAMSTYALMEAWYPGVFKKAGVSPGLFKTFAQTHDAMKVWRGGESDILPHGESMARAIRNNLIDYEPIKSLSTSERDILAGMIEQHTRIHPRLLEKYRLLDIDSKKVELKTPRIKFDTKERQVATPGAVSTLIPELHVDWSPQTLLSFRTPSIKPDIIIPSKRGILTRTWYRPTAVEKLVANADRIARATASKEPVKVNKIFSNLNRDFYKVQYTFPERIGITSRELLGTNRKYQLNPLSVLNDDSGILMPGRKSASKPTTQTTQEQAPVSWVLEKTGKKGTVAFTSSVEELLAPKGEYEALTHNLIVHYPGKLPKPTGKVTGEVRGDIFSEVFEHPVIGEVWITRVKMDSKKKSARKENLKETPAVTKPEEQKTREIDVLYTSRQATAQVMNELSYNPLQEMSGRPRIAAESVRGSTKSTKSETASKKSARSESKAKESKEAKELTREEEIYRYKPVKLLTLDDIYGYKKSRGRATQEAYSSKQEQKDYAYTKSQKKTVVASAITQSGYGKSVSDVYDLLYSKPTDVYDKGYEAPYKKAYSAPYGAYGQAYGYTGGYGGSYGGYGYPGSYPTTPYSRPYTPPGYPPYTPPPYTPPPYVPPQRPPPERRRRDKEQSFWLDQAIKSEHEHWEFGAGAGIPLADKIARGLEEGISDEEFEHRSQNILYGESRFKKKSKKKSSSSSQKADINVNKILTLI